MIDAKRLASGVLDSVRNWIEPTLKDVRERLNELDAKVTSIPAGAKGDKGDSIKGDPGKDADPELIVAEVQKAVAALPPAQAGKDGEVDYECLETIVKATVGAAIETLPEPKQGDPGKDAEIDYDRIGTAIKETVAVAISEIPQPELKTESYSALADAFVSMMENEVAA